MYLEETIEALEVQEDSGLSNDEPELGSQVQKTDQKGENGTLMSCFLTCVCRAYALMTAILTAVIVLFFVRRFQLYV